jgi:hypothetical protein
LDQKTLTIIVITAVITEIVKRLTSWGIRKYKKSELTKTLSVTVDRWLIKENFAIAWDLIAIFILLAFATNWYLIEKGPATKRDIYNALLIAAGVIYFNTRLVFDIFDLVRRRAAERKTLTGRPLGDPS